MECCELVTLVSTLACIIAQDKTPDELALIGSIFNQLGDSLSTIAACKAKCVNEDVSPKWQKCQLRIRPPTDKNVS